LGIRAEFRRAQNFEIIGKFDDSRSCRRHGRGQRHWFADNRVRADAQRRGCGGLRNGKDGRSGGDYECSDHEFIQLIPCFSQIMEKFSVRAEKVLKGGESI
jgi:hypothetical protein